MRNRLLNVCLAALLALVNMSVWALDKVGGVYQIGTANDLAEFADLVNGGQNFSSAVLTSDIDLGNAQVFIGTKTLNYNGTFDGQGHKITINFVPTQAEADNLFGYIGFGGEVRNLIVDGQITTEYAQSAGIAGRSEGIIANCVSLVTIYSNKSGDATHGGIATACDGGAIINCLSAYKVKSLDGKTNGVSQRCGGLVGWTQYATTMRNNLVVADVDLTNYNNSATITRNPNQVQNDCDERGHYLQNFYLTKFNDGSKGTQITAEQLASGEVCYLLNAGLDTPVWTQKPGDPYPMPFPTYGQTVGASEDADCRGRFAEGAEPEFTFGGGNASAKHDLVDGRCTKCGFFDFHAVERDPVDGFYLLKSASDCRWWAWRRYYGDDGVNARLCADVDMGDQPYFSDPVKSCLGEFDGGGHSITIHLDDAELEKSEPVDGFCVQPFTKGYNSMFKTLTGDVHDLIVHGTIHSYAKLAATLSDYLYGTTYTHNGTKRPSKIYNIYSDVDITAEYRTDGTHAGILGDSRYSNNVLDHIVFAGSITTDAPQEAGLIGWCTNPTLVSNSLMIADLDFQTLGDNYAISRNSKNCQLSNVYTIYQDGINNTNGTPYQDGLSFIEDESIIASGELTYMLNGDQSNITWTQTLGEDAAPMPFTTHKQVYGAGNFNCDGTPKGTVSYTNTPGSDNYDEHNFVDGVCTKCYKADYDYLKPNADGKYEISKPAHLINIAQTINNKPGMTAIDIVLTDDLDMDSFNQNFENDAANNFGINEITNGFEPIGIENISNFQGTFDGQFHTISNLHVYRGTRAVGLFGAVASRGEGQPVKIENVVMDETCSIYGTAYVGLIGMSAGVGDTVTHRVIMNNVGIECDILADGANAGGIVGCCMDSKHTFVVTNCYTTGHIKGGKESSAMTGWFGTNAKCYNCWTISEVEGLSSEASYFGRYGTRIELRNCFSLYGTQANVGKITEEDVESGQLTWNLNGKSFASPTWYQNLDEGDEHPSVLPSRGSVYLTDEYHSATDDQVADAANELKTYELSKIEDVLAQQATIDYYTAQLDALEDCATMNELGAAYESLDKDSLQKSVKAYTAYVTRVNSIRAALAETYKTLEGSQVELLKEYLDETNKVEPNGDWPNGSYAYVIEEALLDVPGINAEIARLDAWLDEAIRTCYGAGMEVTDLLANANFAKGFEGWTVNNMTGTYSYTNEDGKNLYSVECWSTKGFDIQQTITGLKPGVYVFAMNGTCRPSDNIYSYNHTATIYANGVHNYIQTPGEDYISVDDAVDMVNCNLTGSTPDFVYFEEPWTNKTYQEVLNNDDSDNPEDLPEVLGYIARGGIGMAIAANAGRYQNYVLAVVGEDGMLTVGATSPGTKVGTDGTLLANARLFYAGANGEDVALIQKAIQSQVDRAQAVLEKYNVELETLIAEPGIPIFSEALKDELRAAAETAESASTLEAKLAAAQKLSQLFLDVYDCKQAYRKLYYHARTFMLAYETFSDTYILPDEVTPMMDPDDAADMCTYGEQALDHYYYGDVTMAELEEVIAGMNTFGIIPSQDEEDGYYLINNGKELVWFSAAIQYLSNSLNAKLTADIDMAGVNFKPIGKNGGQVFNGILDGQDHKLSNLFVDQENDSFVGLIGRCTLATLKNLEVDENSYIHGNRYVGLVGGTYNRDGVVNIDRVSSSAYVKAEGVNGGGLYGCNYRQTVDGTDYYCQVKITNCFVAGIVESYGEGGAITGWLGTNSSSYIRSTLSVAEAMNMNGNAAEQFARYGSGPTTSNNYAYNGGTGATAIVPENHDMMISGEMAYRMNGSKSYDVAWYQTIGVDSIPHLFGTKDIVYNYKDTYTNEKPYVALNPYAYGLGVVSTANNVTVGYTLLSKAKNGKILFKKLNGDVVATIELTAENLTAGVHDVLVDNAELGADAGTELTLAVVVDGYEMIEASYVDEVQPFYSARGLAVNNCPTSEGFGQIYVTEAKCKDVIEPDAEKNPAEFSNSDNGNGAGLYVFQPDWTPVAAANGKFGFKGGQTYVGNAYELSPKTVRVSDDGRVFVARQDGRSTSSLQEVDPANLDADFTDVFVGGQYNETEGVTYVGDDVQNGMFVSFDVEGKGDDLKIHTLEFDNGGAKAQQTGFWSSIFNLGAAKTWSGAPSGQWAPLFHQWTVNYEDTQVLSDKNGGLWYIQYRSNPNADEPSIKHISKDGEVDYSSTTAVVTGSGAVISPDGQTMVYMNGSSLSVAEIIYAPNAVTGMIALVNRYTIALRNGGTNSRAMAFDYAGNLLVLDSNHGIIERIVLPTEGSSVTTPFAYSFKVGENTAVSVDGIDANALQNGEIYTIEGLRVNKAQKGVNIVNGKKVMVK